MFPGEDTGWHGDTGLRSPVVPSRPGVLLTAQQHPSASSQLLPRESWARMSAPWSMSSRTISSLPTQAAKDKGCSPGDTERPQDHEMRGQILPGDCLLAPPRVSAQGMGHLSSRTRGRTLQRTTGISLWPEVLEGGPSASPEMEPRARPCLAPPWPVPGCPPALPPSPALALTIVDEVVGTALEGGACGSGRDAGPVGEQGAHQVHILVHDSDVQGSLTWPRESHQSRVALPQFFRDTPPSRTPSKSP